MFLRLLIFTLFVSAMSVFSQTAPTIKAGVPQTLARWRAANYSDVRYKLNLTLEKMSPVLKGTVEVSLKNNADQIVLDWRKLRGKEDLSRIENVFVNGKPVVLSSDFNRLSSGEQPAKTGTQNFYEINEHLVFKDGVVKGENVVRLDFTSPILTSGSATTRYVDKEDGAEYVYSLFVPSDASTAFPVFDQPDLKARFQLNIIAPEGWKVVSNAEGQEFVYEGDKGKSVRYYYIETKPISTYVFAFAAGGFIEVYEPRTRFGTIIYVRKSQAEKFKQHAAEVFRLNREAVKYLESYFDYKFPFPKYDLVLIPEFPFGGMEHAGATFLREDRIVFPTEPTKNDFVTRANLIFHEAAHQWFGDTVTMRWFDDLWLKEGFAEFMAYKTLEKVMPEYNAWKIFYERNKQAAYLTDSTKGTTPIYQEIPNLSAAKSAYGNIVYRKAPSFLKQAEFYLGADKFQTAVRAFLKKHQFANAEWTDLVKEFETASGQDLKDWAEFWVKQKGVFQIKIRDQSFNNEPSNPPLMELNAKATGSEIEIDSKNRSQQIIKFKALVRYKDGKSKVDNFRGVTLNNLWGPTSLISIDKEIAFLFPNYQDYGYGIFLLDERSRAYVLENIQNEPDDFLRTMMWGSLWDSVREAELAPADYVELVIKNLALSSDFSRQMVDKKTAKNRNPNADGKPPEGGTQNIVEIDESTIQTLLGRVSTAMNYYLSDAQSKELAPRVENVLLNRMAKAETVGQKITFYRAFLNAASTDTAKKVLKDILENNGKISLAVDVETKMEIDAIRLVNISLPLKTKDKFDIAAKLLTLNDADAPRVLAELEKTEKSDEAKRYAYATRAGIGTAENKATFWTDFIGNKDLSENWIESAFVAFNAVRHSELTLPYLEKALAELPNLKRTRKIFFVNIWLAAFVGGQRSEQALNTVNEFLADNPNLDKDLRLKVLEVSDNLERSVKIRKKFTAL